MPEQDYWESLFEVDAILNGLGIRETMTTVAEAGCGYGTFTVPLARRISGTVHGFDIEPAMISATSARVTAAAVHNVRLHLRDVMADGFGLPAESVDGVLLFNILHTENPENVLRMSVEMLNHRGRAFVIHWRSDVVTPRGPALAIRPRPEQIIEWAQQAGLAPDGPVQTLLPWHFGLVFRRQS